MLKRVENGFLQEANRILKNFSISEPAKSMDNFWNLIEKTHLGHVTYWNTYENGRRIRLEKELTAMYYAENAILVNSGMSALTVSILSSLTSSNNYNYYKSKYIF